MDKKKMKRKGIVGTFLDTVRTILVNPSARHFLKIITTLGLPRTSPNQLRFFAPKRAGDRVLAGRRERGPVDEGEVPRKSSSSHSFYTFALLSAIAWRMRVLFFGGGVGGVSSC